MNIHKSQAWAFYNFLIWVWRRLACVASWVVMPSWTNHLLYCNHCWHISQAHLFGVSLLPCSEKGVQTFIRWIQPGLNWEGSQAWRRKWTGLPKNCWKMCSPAKMVFFPSLWQGRGVAGRGVNDCEWFSQCSMIQTLKRLNLLSSNRHTSD